MTSDELLSVGMSSTLAQEVVKQADIPQEVTGDEPKPSPPASKEQVETPRSSKERSEPEPEFNPDEYTGASLLALELQKDGIIPKDAKIEKNLSGKELRQLAKESFKKDFNQMEQELKEEVLSKGYSEDDLKYARLLRQGVPQEELSQISVYQQMASINLENGIDDLEEVLPDYLSQYYKDSGVRDAKAIKKLVEADIDEDGGEGKAKEAKDFYNKLALKEISRVEKEAKDKEAAIKNQEVEKTNAIKESISKGKIGAFELTDAEKDEFNKYLFENTEEIVGSDGKKYKVPPYYKDLSEYNQNLEQQLVMAYMMKKKFSLEDVKSMGKEEDKKDLLDFLDKQARSTAQHAKKSELENFEVLIQT